MNTKEELLETNKLIKWLVIITAILIFSNIVNTLLGSPSWQIDRLINMGYEANFPTWLSSMILVVAAYFAFRCSRVAQINKNGKRMWQLLSIWLIFMSCDEVAQIHENLGSTINKYFFRIESIKHSSWVIIIGPIILLLIFIFAFKMNRYLTNSFTAKRYLISGLFIYVLGAFVFESTINLLNHNKLEWIWKIEIILEESCEMFGIIIIILGLLEHYKFLLEYKSNKLSR